VATEVISGFSISPQQQRLWSIGAGDNPDAYRSRCWIELEGPLDQKALRAAIEMAVCRHEALRTSFHVPPDMTLPVQVVGDSRVVWQPDLNLTNWSAESSEKEIERLYSEGVPGPYLAARLILLSADHATLLLSLPALCGDAATMSSLVPEIGACYDASRRSGDPATGVQLQYPDVAAWLNDLLNSPEAEPARQFWRSRPVGNLTAQRLPFEKNSTDHPGPPRQLDLRLAREIVAKLRSLARRRQSSLRAILLTAWCVLLRRFGLDSEVTVGVGCTCRKYEGLENALGLLARYVPVRAAQGSGNSFAEVLEEIELALTEADEYQEYFSWGLTGHSEPSVPFFSFGFDFTECPSGQEWSQVTFSLARQHTTVDRFHLRLSCTQKEGGLEVCFQWEDSAYTRAAIERLASGFAALLADAAARPEVPCSQLEVLDQAEESRLIANLNDTPSPFPSPHLLHRLFEAQVERTPDAIAVSYEDQSLTYTELNRRANQLAQHLRKQDVGPGKFVAVAMDRSLELVEAILAVLKAGAAYVPLDPSYPKERLDYMLSDSAAAVVLTNQHLMLLRDELSQEGAANPEWEVAVDDAAYVIYTSGSTGRPKGVVISHRAICNHMYWMRDAFPLTASDRVLQKTPFSFDASVWEFYAPLLHGAQLVMARPGGHQDAAYLAQTIAQQEITIIQLVPSLLRTLLEEEGFARTISLRAVFCGGEALSRDLLERFFGRFKIPLNNLYGPTECAIDTVFWTCQPADENASVPIGRPVANTQLYVLDENLQLLPFGVPGELHIGGTQLARGYLNRPDLTAEKFIPDLFGTDPGSRLYKTGDLVRYREDGALEYLGRIDHQVKLRGFRIELGEIESWLLKHPKVRESVAVVREDKLNDKRLVAYVVLRPGDAPTTDELRNYMAKGLPEYMVPSAFVVLPSLPVTPNGKVDRQALPAPGTENRSYAAPTNAVEELLAAIWAQVLGTERVGIHDNFFHIGGHSLMATQLISRIRSAFQVELPLRCLFETPTVAEIARQVQSLQGRAAIPAIVPRRSGEYVGLSFAQQRLWFLDQLVPGSPLYHMPVSIRLSGKLSVNALHQSFNQVVNRHEALRTTFPFIDGRPVQMIQPASPVELHCIDVSSISGAGQDSLICQLTTTEFQRPFDLAAGPLLRVKLLKLQEQEHILLLTMHHIVSDGWSLGVLVRELTDLYRSLCTGTSADLPELSIQYADFAQWQSEWLQGGTLENQLDYWKHQLEGSDAPLSLSKLRPRPPVQTHRGSRETVLLPADLAQSLNAASRREGVTLFMTLLAAYQILLSRYSGRTKISVGSPIANRTRGEVEPLIGFFVNTLVFRTDLSGDPDFRELLQRVRNTCLGAYAHQDLPFERLVEALQPERDLAHNPLFQAAFVLQNSPADDIALPDLSWQVLDSSPGIAKFDLTLEVTERPDGLRASFEYNTDVFDAEFVRGMLSHFRRLLDHVAMESSTRISELPLLSTEDQSRILEEWNATETPYPDKCVHELVEDQVNRTPEAVAVQFGNRQLSYRELNCRANQIARYLRRRGVKPGDLVGIALERSPEMAAAWMAVLKAGAAYLPLDPTYPRERLSFMMRDSDARFLLVQGDVTAQAEGVEAVVDLDSPDIRQELDGNLPVFACSDSLAYVMYTSGSTGVPKGITVPHRGIVRLVVNTNYVGLDASDVMAQVSNASFDAITFELWGALLNGARVFGIAKETALSPRDLAREIREQGITTMFLTTALFNQLAREAPEALRAMRTMLFGGQAADVQSVRHAIRSSPPRRLLNAYGPTENTTFSACHLVESVPEDAGTVPIGRPIANTRMYVLDANLQPVPPGVTGEIYIGGDGLAHGYLNRPELTAQTFIPHAFSGKPGERLYRTGDRGAYLDDGSIVFQGRFDDQCKIRGFRVEPGEIETAISRHPDIAQCTVIVREDKPGDQRLVAYYVKNAGDTFSDGDLRHFLRQTLPDYMVPAALVPLESLPLTANGKVNRALLPSPEFLGSRAEDSLSRPRTPVEELLAGIWREVLNLECAGIEDNFFESGGHSLLAAQFVSRVRDAFAIELPVRCIFESPTIAGLASRLVEYTEEPAKITRIAELTLSLSRLSNEEIEQMLQAEKASEEEQC
jgi:amino acid adenylation domain-containing protein